ncbi:hypothetical protein ACFZ8E_06240 [Methylobacterium sp. HMF5984]|uniref:hypothetical protein n=1 Tax=Methylobacterium sp. HMF5984 TaxID=3367370 RepID=UPI0038527C2B
MQDVPGHATQSTCYRTRAHIAALGYWTYAPGSGITATVYYFKRDPAPHVLALLKANEERRKSDVQARMQALLGDTQTLQSQHKEKRRRRTRKSAEPLQREHNEPLQTSTQPCVENAGMSSLSSPPQETLPSKEVAQVASASQPSQCFICGRSFMGFNNAAKPVCVRHLARPLREEIAYRGATNGE